jgi:hypothetical protein
MRTGDFAMSNHLQQEPPSTPWWRHGMVWLVVSGPLAVVIAGFVTLGIAIAYPDPVLPALSAPTHTDAPAMQARNHAATPR